MTKYYCPYCDWSGWEPDELAYENTPAGRAEFSLDMARFRGDQSGHPCNNSKITDDMIRDLSAMTTRDEAGQHFTARFDAGHVSALEAAGLITIDRPVHDATGISYDQQYWSVAVTDAGQELVDSHPDLHPAI